MILKGCSSITDLRQILVFQDLSITQLESLIPYSYIREYQPDEIVMYEGERLDLNTVHGLISERAIVRLIRLIQYYQTRDGVNRVAEGDRLNIQLPYYQIARSIGITYEECVRLFKKLKEVVIYKRGGTIIVKDWKKLEAAIVE
jgi:CRP-like cAMP-binding protein